MASPKPGSLKDILLRLGVKDDASGPLGKVARAMGHLERQGSAIGAAGKHFATGIGRIAAVGGAAATGLGLLLKHTIEAGDALGEQSQRVGMSANSYAALAHSAAQADVGQEAFTASLDKFNTELGKAKAGGGEMLSFLQKVSPALARQVVGAQDSETALVRLADAFAKLDDPSKRAALAAALFGRSNQQMGQWLGQGRDAILDQSAAYLQVAGDQERAVEAAGRLDNAYRDAMVPIERLGQSVMLALTPSLERLAKNMEPLVARLAPRFEAWAGRLATWLEGPGPGRFADQLGRAVDAVGWLVEALGPMGTALLVTIPLWGPLVAGVAAFVATAGAVPTMLLTIAGSAIVVGANLRDFSAAVKDVWVDIKWAFADGLAWIEHVVEKAGGLLGVFGAPLGALVAAGTERGWTARANGGAGGQTTGANPSMVASALAAPQMFTTPALAVRALAARGTWGREAPQPPGQPGNQRGNLVELPSVTGVTQAARGAQAPAQVRVEFVSAPKGMRVKDQRDGSAEVTTDIGYTVGGEWW